MSEKLLDESEWKKFSKGGDYKDAALLKALAALAKAAPAECGAALDEVEKQGELLLKAHKGDKKLAEHWKTVAAALVRERKAATAAAEAEAASADDDDASPAVLTTKMVPLLRMVPKGETLQAVVAYVGDQTAVMVSRKAIGAPQRKLLATQLGVSGGVKYLAGQCLFEKNLHTFVLETLVAGMAKKLKAALLAQTEMRWKIRVRGLDPNVVEEDLDEDGAPPADAGGSPADPARTAYEARLSELTPELTAALRDPKRDGSKMRAVLEFARGKAEAGDYAAGSQGLEALAKLLGAAPNAPPATPAAGGDAPTVDPARAFTARLQALMPQIQKATAAGGELGAAVKARSAAAAMAAKDKEFVAADAALDEIEGLLEAREAQSRAAMAGWRAARQAAIDDIDDVIEAVRATGDPDASKVEIELKAIIANLTENPDTPQAVAELRRWLESDDVITAAEEVPPHYGALDLRRPLLAALAVM